MNDIFKGPELMIEFNFPEPQERKSLIIGLNVFAILTIISIQTLIILGIGSNVTIRGCLTFLLQIIIFYLCQYWVLPKAFHRGEHARFLIRLILLIFSQVIIRGLIAYSAKSGGRSFLQFLLSQEQVAFASTQLIIVFSLSFFMGLIIRNEQLRQKYLIEMRAKLEAYAEMTRIESIMSQMKLSPHLLFNTLSYIKVKARSEPDKIEAVVNLVSKILRHSLIDIQEIKTKLLTDEIAEVQNLIELHKQLSEGHFYIDFEENYHNANKVLRLPPSILLTFAENIIRYGIVNDPDYRPIISVLIEGCTLTFKTSNYKKANPQPGTGQGIKSVVSTLAYYYPEKYSLIVEDLDDTFILNLIIQL